LSCALEICDAEALWMALACGKGCVRLGTGDPVVDEAIVALKSDNCCLRRVIIEVGDFELEARAREPALQQSDFVAVVAEAMGFHGSFTPEKARDVATHAEHKRGQQDRRGHLKKSDWAGMRDQLDRCATRDGD
jgi:hypothetical protein